jgi:hypothetical protein
VEIRLRGEWGLGVGGLELEMVMKEKYRGKEIASTILGLLGTIIVFKPPFLMNLIYEN